MACGENIELLISNMGRTDTGCTARQDTQSLLLQCGRAGQGKGQAGQLRVRYLRAGQNEFAQGQFDKGQDQKARQVERDIMMCCKTVCDRRGDGMVRQGQGRGRAGQGRGMVRQEQGRGRAGAGQGQGRAGRAEQGTFDESHHVMIETAEKLTLSDMEVSARLNPLS